MADNNAASFWTDEQWSQIRQAIAEEMRAARVAGNVLPIVGPLEPDESVAPMLTLLDPADPRSEVKGLSVEDTTTLKLPTLQVKVFLRQSQVADPGLEAALFAFRRAANVLAHLEDAIVFKGQGALPPGYTAQGGAEILGGETVKGLQVIEPGQSSSSAPKDNPNLGERLVSAVSDAVGALERRFQTGPFACVLGANYFKAVQSPNTSLVLPQDRILPFLNGGPLVRSSALEPDAGLVIALGGAPIDLVIATDATVEFLQTTQEAWFLFRVYEKMVLRVKDPKAVQHLKA
jgi:Uncharacterized protein, linocin/CFP29 homolog